MTKERTQAQKVELHNRVSKEAMRVLFDTLKTGGTVEELLVILESVVFGVALTVIKVGGDEIVLDALMERVKERLAIKRKSKETK